MSIGSNKLFKQTSLRTCAVIQIALVCKVTEEKKVLFYVKEDIGFYGKENNRICSEK